MLLGALYRVQLGLLSLFHAYPEPLPRGIRYDSLYGPANGCDLGRFRVVEYEISARGETWDKSCLRFVLTAELSLAGSGVRVDMSVEIEVLCQGHRRRKRRLIVETVCFPARFETWAVFHLGTQTSLADNRTVQSPECRRMLALLLVRQGFPTLWN